MQHELQNLIQVLNDRYQTEFDRAERLAAELRHIQSSRLWRLCCLLRSAVPWQKQPAETSPQVAPFESVCLTPGMPATGLVSIIIPFRDRFELLRNCLQSLWGTSSVAYELILIDNGSRQTGFPEDLLRDRPHRLLRCDEPFNFSRLCNLGATAASGEHLLFLNNDTELLGPDWLSQMLRLLALPEVGIVGATLLYPDRTIQHAGIYPRTDRLWMHLHRGQPENFPGEHGELLEPRSVPAVTGACLLIRAHLFREIGGFDESLPVTMNDVDLCLRVRQRGLLTAISPDAKLLHFESLSRGFGHGCV